MQAGTVAPSEDRRRSWPSNDLRQWAINLKKQYFDWCFSWNTITASISKKRFKLFTSLNTKLIVSIV